MGKVLLRVGVSIFFLGLLFYSMRDDLPGVLDTLGDVKPAFVIAGLVCYLLAAFLIAYRLKIIFGVQDIPITLRQSWDITMIGFFFNTFLPTSVGGDIVKAYCGSRITGERLKSFVAVLVDRLFGLFMFILVPACTVVFLFDRLSPTIVWTVFGALGCAMLAGLMLAKRGWTKALSFLKPFFEKIRMKDKLVMMYDGMHHFKYHKKAVGKVLLLSVSAQALGMITVYLFILAISANINVLYVFLLTPVVLLMSMIPSIGGIGVRENAFKFLFAEFIGLHEAVALGFLYLFLLFVMSLIGGAVYMVRHQYHFRMKEIQSEPKVLNGDAQ